MAQPDVGPNDIVIHLVNPYKCASCGTEFFLRSMLLEHLGEHIDKQKAENPCRQVVCGVSLADHTDNGITVTRDILQINEQQMFELQDPNLDYSQLAPLKALEQAGILSLPPKPPTPDRSLLRQDISRGQPYITSGIGGLGGNKISLLKQSPVSLPPKEPIHVQMEILDPSVITGHVEEPVQPHHTDVINAKTEIEPNIADLDAIVQQALFSDGRIKGEYSIMIEAPPTLPGQLQTAAGDAPQIFVTEGQPNFADSLMADDLSGLEEKSILGKKKKKPVCAVCSHEFSNQNALERHQVVHTGEKPHRCLICFKQFNDVSSLRKHSLIHKRQHRCPICHRLYLRKMQLIMHMKHHGKKRFIQFGNSFHEVKVATTRNSDGQMVQEYSLMMLLGEDGKKEGDQSGESHQGDGKVEAMAPANCESEDKVGNEAELRRENEDFTVQQQSGTEYAGEGSINIATSIEESNPAALASEGGEQQQGDSSVKKKSVIYKCGHCKKVIFTRATLSRHLIRHTNKRPFTCELCPKSFRDKTDLVHHYKTHTKPVKCPTCTAAFSKPLYLEKHLQKGCPVTANDSRFTVLRDLKCRCNLCGKVLKSKTNVIRHLRVHAFDDRAKSGVQTSENAVAATLQTNEASGPPVIPAETSAALSENVEDHYRPLEDSVGFSCLICGQEFRFRSFMKTHILMHLDVRPFKCPECSKTFFARHMLKKHLQNHTRPYKCPVCNKGFIRRYLMRQHFKKKHEDGEGDDMEDITVLEGQKMIQCDICGKTMQSFQKSLMRYHVRMHKDVRPFECSECQKKFSSENALKRHSSNHKKPYVCQVCNKGFSRRYLLMSHFKKQCKFSVSNSSKEVSETEKPDSVDDRAGEDDRIDSSGETETTAYQPKVIEAFIPETGKIRYHCEPCDKSFLAYETLFRHLNTFARATACKHCCKVFEDKHLTMVHQRSCLGVNTVVKGKAATSKTTKSPSLGQRQEKMQRIMTEVKKTIDSVTSDLVEVDKGGVELTVTNVSGDVLTFEDKESSDLAKPTNVLAHNTPSAVQNRMETVQKTLVILKEKEGRFTCPECSKTFTTPRGLKIHANSHLRLYKCEVCNKDFTQLAELRIHSLSHEENGHEIESDFSTDKNLGESKENETGMSTKGSTEHEEDEAKITTPIRGRGKGRVKKVKNVEENKDDASDDDKIAEINLEHKDFVGVSQRLMQSGTRGRPFSCKMCRRRFTEQSGLESHMLQVHGVRLL